MDGMILSDGTPTPGLYEFKAVVAPVRVRLEHDAKTGRLELTALNKQHSADTANYSYLMRTEHDGVSVVIAELDVPTLAPGESTPISLPEIPISDRAESWVTLDVVLRTDTLWAESGHVVSTAQIDLTSSGFPLSQRDIGRAAVTSARREAAGRLAESSSERTLTLGPAVFSGGELVELGDTPVGGMQFTLWRAPIDNDRVNVAAWLEAGLDRLETRVESMEATPGSLRVCSRHAPANSPLAFWTDTTWDALGRDSVHVRVNMIPSAGWDIVLPRMGLRLALPPAVDEAS